MTRVTASVVGIVLGLIAWPRLTSAQGINAGAIVGVVKDTSGAVLPGVTVEASSPVLIEKVRTAVTDNNGQYGITELRPGTYLVTFSLPGFSTLKREGLEVTPNFTTSVNADLRIGAVEETITVSGAAPLVDVTTVTSGKTLASDLINTVPTSKSLNAIMALLPSALTATDVIDVGGTKGEQNIRISMHGAKTNDQRQQLDGMLFSTTKVDGSGRLYFVNSLAMQETVVDLGTAGSAQYSTGGAVINAIPKDGGNRFAGTIFGAFTNHSLQANNFSDDLRTEGLASVNGLRNIYDWNGVLGGPLMTDTIWFMTAHRFNGKKTRVANLFYDSNLNDFLFTPDPTRPVEPLDSTHSHLTRLTWQSVPTCGRCL